MGQSGTKPLSVMTIIGTRPEIIKLSRVIAELDRCMDHILVHTGQNYDYELGRVFFEQLSIRQPDHYLDAAGTTACQTIGNVIAKTDDLLAEVTPDAVLILGDTNSCLAVIAAKRRRIPVFHMEAGNRCFDQRVPEEINRRIIDHVSDINMTYSEHARRCLLAEGLRPEMTIKTGSPMREVIDHYRALIEPSDILERLEVQPGRYIVFSAHREENVDDPTTLAGLLETIQTVVDRYDRPVLFSVHPRTRRRLGAANRAISDDPRVRFLKPLGFCDYVKLQMNAFCTLSDSGTITEESAILGFPAVTIRKTQERHEGMDEATVIMSGLQTQRVLQAVDLVTSQFDPQQRRLNPVADYQATNVSLKVARIIHSYVDYVNRTVWFRHV